MSKLSLALEEHMNEEISKIECAIEFADEPQFSNEFNKGMNKIISKSEKPYVRIGSHSIRRVLLIACILVLIFALAMSVSAIRKPFINMFVHYEDQSSDIEFKKDAGSDTEFKWVFIEPEVPTEFKKMTENKVEDSLYEIQYESENGQYINYSQMDAGNVGLGVDTEDANAIEYEINGYKVLETSKYGTNTITWTDGIYGFQLIGTCDMATLESIMKKVN